jgi:hypothetical protein
VEFLSRCLGSTAQRLNGSLRAAKMVRKDHKLGIRRQYPLLTMAQL